MSFIDRSKHLELKMVKHWSILLVLFICLILIGNRVGYKISVFEALPGMIILVLIGLSGFILEKIIPVKLPALVYISVIGMLVALPACPISSIVVEYTSKVENMAMSTVALAYSGIAIGNNWEEFKKMSWRGILVAAFAIFGTYIASAIVAQLILSSQGII